jgi:uncharacterized protein (TIGR03086 family)
MTQSSESGEVDVRYGLVVAGFLTRVHGVSSDGWQRPSPCKGWTVRDVIAHVLVVHRRVLVRLHGGLLPSIEPPPARPGEHLASDIRDAAAAVTDALWEPGCASRQVDSIIGQITFGQLVGTLLCADVLLHTWDVARATGQDERLDPHAVSAAMRFLGPRDADLRVPEEFGPRIDPPPGCDEQAALIAFAGRGP